MFSIHDWVRVTYPFDHTFDGSYPIVADLGGGTFELDGIGAFHSSYLQAA
jgi:hypothetical protein